MKGFINGMRFVVKYGAYLYVIFEILGFAIEKFEELEAKNSKDGTKSVSEQS